MTVELKNRHWLLFFVLAGIQFGGLWIALTRSTRAPAVYFFMRGVSFGLVILISFVIASSFTTTVILAKLTEVFTKQK